MNKIAGKKILIISHNFPPDFSVGLLRTLNFVENLGKLGWETEVLTTKRLTKTANLKNVKNIPENTAVKRIYYLDSEEDLSIKGKYFAFTAYPDRYLSWVLFSFIYYFFKKKGGNNLDIIFSTYPVASSHLLGYFLCKLLNKPWIADFRDPMLQDDYPEGTTKKRIWRWIENRVVNNASHLLFTTDSAKETYLKNYPQLHPDRCHVIFNGYREGDFADLTESARRDDHIKIIHAGGLYPRGRNPYFFFKALKVLLESGDITPSQIQIEFYGTGNDQLVSGFKKDVESFGLTESIHFLPGLPHNQILQKMADADVLLLIQDASWDKQIPAKIYEYFRLRKPVLALTTEKGETGRLIKKNNAGFVVRPDDYLSISRIIKIIFKATTDQNQAQLPIIPQSKLVFYSRVKQTEHLSEILASCFD